MFYHGGRVAVFSKTAGELIAIDSIEHIDVEFVRLSGGAMFRLPDGQSLTKPGSTYIVPAMPEHLQELKTNTPRYPPVLDQS
jgi:hypothetical protein